MFEISNIQTGIWIHKTGLWIHKTGLWIHKTGLWIHKTGLWIHLGNELAIMEQREQFRGWGLAEGRSAELS
jgi:hypothetical protein